MKRSAPAHLVVALAACAGSASTEPGPPPAKAQPSRASVVTAAPDAGAPTNRSDCPQEMAEIDGEYCKEVAQRCLAKRLPWQCAEFEEPSRCTGEVIAMHYCIDRFEWPNRRGELPAVMFTWKEAKQACEGTGKRLCSEAEWTLACEGPERLPFPYGYTRDSEACPIDKRSPRVDERRLNASQTRDAELARVDQREPSGSRPRCVSASGVFDLTGNVDEWVVSQFTYPHRSALKGGNWGQFRNACRPATRKHDENWRFYQTGFRCCREPDAAPPADR